MGLMLFAVIGGLMGLSKLALDAEPDVPVPIINVRVVLPGVSPEDAQRLLIRPMEAELKSLDGLKQMDGIAANSYAVMVLEFQASFDQDKAIQDVIESFKSALNIYRGALKAYRKCLKPISLVSAQTCLRQSLTPP